MLILIVVALTRWLSGSRRLLMTFLKLGELISTESGSQWFPLSPTFSISNVDLPLFTSQTYEEISENFELLKEFQLVEDLLLPINLVKILQQKNILRFFRNQNLSKSTKNRESVFNLFIYIRFIVMLLWAWSFHSMAFIFECIFVLYCVVYSIVSRYIALCCVLIALVLCSDEYYDVSCTDRIRTSLFLHYSDYPWNILKCKYFYWGIW